MDYFPNMEKKYCAKGVNSLGNQFKIGLTLNLRSLYPGDSHIGI